MNPGGLFLLQPRAADAQIEIKWHSPEDSLPVEMDGEGIHRALLNVLTNAIDACNEELPGGRTGLVSIDAAVSDNWAKVSITDNGLGMTTEERARIFVPFESKKGAKGTGLGLPVSQKILREHSGEIIVNSQPGKGTRFVLSWPTGQQMDSLPTLIE